jgi:hypothetical protein
MFTNPQLNVATLLLTVLLILALAGLMAFLLTRKEINRMKYPGNVKLRKYKFSEKGNERQENEFLDVFIEPK